jgi:hypothetical protein
MPHKRLNVVQHEHLALIATKARHWARYDALCARAGTEDVVDVRYKLQRNILSGSGQLDDRLNFLLTGRQQQLQAKQEGQQNRAR